MSIIKKWKWNWGTGLALVLALFIITMGFTLYRASQHRWNLVTDNYYEHELAYQEIIDGRENASKLAGRARIKWDKQNMYLHLPKGLQGKVAQGEIHWYYLQDQRRDFTDTLQNWNISAQKWPLKKFASGQWTAKVKISVEDTPYYFEPQITLP